MTSEPKKTRVPAASKSISEIGRELLKYLYGRIEEIGVNQAGYRQARMEMLRILADAKGQRRFNWGFEAVFSQEIHILEDLGLLAVKYGSGAIMAGRGTGNQIYNLSLTTDGIDTARIIIDREDRARTETSRVNTKTDRVEPADDDDDDEDLDETDKEPDTTMVERVKDDRRGESRTSQIE